MKLPAYMSITSPRVEMMPLIDVIFLVLIAFIYASMFMSPKQGLPIDLPESSEAESVLSEVITLTIMRDGSLLLNQQPVTIDLLGAALATAQAGVDREISVYIRAHRRARLDPLVKVMDIVRKTGISGLTIATDRKTDDSETP